MMSPPELYYGRFDRESSSHVGRNAKDSHWIKKISRFQMETLVVSNPWRFSRTLMRVPALELSKKMNDRMSHRGVSAKDVSIGTYTS